MSTKTIKSGLSKANVNAIAGAIGTATLNRLVPQFSTSVAYTKGQYTNYNNQLYRFTADKNAGAWDSTKVESASLNDLIQDVNDAVDSVNNKANVDGNYPTMTVGNADQLNSTVYVLDKVPYLYRTSGGDADIGNREYDKIIGGSIVVNQLVQNYNFVSDSGWTSIVPSTISVSNNVLTCDTTGNYGGCRTTIPNSVIGHKYLILTQMSNTKNSAIQLGAIEKVINQSESIRAVSFIVNAASSSPNVNIYVNSNDACVITISKYFNVIDLTQMLDSTIADYIYALEQANTGAGVAWFRNYFKELYYPYNTGAIKNVKLVSHDMVGFNQWDEEWENGSIDNTTGQNIPASSLFRSKNYIPVFPNTTYYFYCKDIEGMVGAGIPIYCYDKDYNYLGRNATPLAPNNQTFVVPNDCHYIRFRTGTDFPHPQVYQNDICINLSWSGWRNGQYEPYQKNSYPLDTTIELRGIPKLDADNHLYFDGDEYSSDGKVVRKYGIVDLGTLSWTYGEGYGGFYSDHLTQMVMNDKAICSKYDYKGIYTNVTDKTIGYIFTDRLFVKDSTYGTDAATFKTAMSGVYLIYELATPTEETATPFQEPQIVDDFGTEEYVVPTQDGWEIPVGHDTKYPANLRDKLQRLPDMPSVSQNVTETYVVNYNGTTKKCTFVAIDTWLGSNGYKKASDLPTNEAVGGTLRQLLASSENVDFLNTDFVDLSTLDWITNDMPIYMYSNDLVGTITQKVMCSNLKTVGYQEVNNNLGTCGINSGGTIKVCVSSIDDLKGVLLAYEKASS